MTIRVTSDLSTLNERLPYPIVAIGVFDGVHRGHQSILRILGDRARQFSGTAVLLSFSPHPQKVISPQTAPPLIQTLEQKRELLAAFGVQVVVELPFTRSLSLLSPRDFVEQKLVRHGIREIHVGSNFRFGHRRSGDFTLLRRLGAQHSFQVFEAPIVEVRKLRVSSTRVRDFLRSGNVSMAARLLGRPYQIRGTVVRGARRGHEIGFPTANLEVQNELIPAPGVYVSRSLIQGEALDSVTNIGYRPTLESNAALTIETHLLDFDQDLYGKPMGLDFCCRIRGERKFSGIQELKDRIAQDVQRAKRLLAISPR